MKTLTRFLSLLALAQLLSLSVLAQTAPLSGVQSVTFNIPPSVGYGAQIMSHVDSPLIMQIVSGILAIALAWVGRKNAQHKSLLKTSLGVANTIAATPEGQAIGNLAISAVRAEAESKGLGPLLTALSPVYHEVISAGVAKIKADLAAPDSPPLTLSVPAPSPALPSNPPAS